LGARSGGWSGQRDAAQAEGQAAARPNTIENSILFKQVRYIDILFFLFIHRLLKIS
jgi:hypothetical protein